MAGRLGRVVGRLFGVALGVGALVFAYVLNGRSLASADVIATSIRRVKYVLHGLPDWHGVGGGARTGYSRRRYRTEIAFGFGPA